MRFGGIGVAASIGLVLAGCSSAHAPDLRQSAAVTDFAYLKTIAQGGALASMGMPQYDDMTDEELRDVQMFLRREVSTPPTKMKIGPVIR